VLFLLSDQMLQYFFKVDVLVKNSKKFSATLSEGEKKVCLWPQPGGGTCGKTFTKLDSLKRHLAETHKGAYLRR